jgi:hypothetical protein
MDNRLLVTQYHGCWVVDLYHRWRTHLALDKDAPESRSTQTPDEGLSSSVPKSTAFTIPTNDGPLDRRGASARSTSTLIDRSHARRVHERVHVLVM